MDQKSEFWAIFWCDLLRPILYGDVEPEETHRYLKTLTTQPIVFPDGRCRCPSLSTLKRKLTAYRKKGFDGLARKPRTDLGKSRSAPAEMIEAAIALKKEQPYRSDVVINRMLKEKFGKSIARSTLYRHLKEADATRLKLGVCAKPVRKRWSRNTPHDLWVGDFEEGPYVMDGVQVVPTYLSAFIDCRSRYMVAARYYYRQNLDVLVDTLLRGLASHGAPLGLYVDNAKVYHSNGLKSACYRTNIRLLFRKSGDPAGGGLIERFFLTAQKRFEAEVRAGDILTLETLNRAFSAWLSQDYHKTVHTEIDITPEEALKKACRAVRQVDLNRFVASFMQRENRTVHATFSDVQLNKMYYKVDPRLRGDRVEVRYDPFARRNTVEIYSLKKGQYLGEGQLHQRETAQPTPPLKPTEKPQHSYIDLLQDLHERELSSKTKGIDYRNSVSQRQWPFHEFAKLTAELTGRKGGLSTFNAEELELLKKTWNMNTEIDKKMLRQACASAIQKNVPCVIHELKLLFKQKGE